MKRKSRKKNSDLGLVYEQETAILEFTEQLAEALDEKGITRTALAEGLGVRPPYITQILRGSNNFSFKTAVAIAYYLRKKFRVVLEDRNLDDHRNARKLANLSIAAARTSYEDAEPQIAMAG